MKLKINFFSKISPEIDRHQIKNVVKRILWALKKKKNYELDINFISEAEIRLLNKKFRKKDRPTSILAFAMKETKGKFILPPSRYQYLGEIFLCPRQIARQAKVLKISTSAYLTRLLVHGILHLEGYTHNSEKGARKMEREEQRIIKALEEKD